MREQGLGRNLASLGPTAGAQNPPTYNPYISLDVMTRTKGTLLGIAVFAAGVFVGGGVTARFADEFIAQLGEMEAESNSISSEGGVYMGVRLLNILRSGDNTKAIAVLENQLDGNLISLGAMPEQRRKERTLKALRLAKEYRERFPRATHDPEVDASVQRTLDLVDRSGK